VDKRGTDICAMCYIGRFPLCISTVRGSAFVTKRLGVTISDLNFTTLIQSHQDINKKYTYHLMGFAYHIFIYVILYKIFVNMKIFHVITIMFSNVNTKTLCEISSSHRCSELSSGLYCSVK
jgi:hypothetical protein